MLIIAAVYFHCLAEKLGKIHAFVVKLGKISNALHIYVNYTTNM